MRAVEARYVRRARPRAERAQSRDQLVVERVATSSARVRAARLVLDVRAVRLDRADAEVELLADLRVRVAERDQAQDLELALGEVVGRPGGRRRGGEPGAELGVEVGPALRGRADRLHELGVGGLLEHVAARAGLQRLARERGVVLHRQHDHGGALRELGDRGQARRPGHVEVEDQDVGPVRARPSAAPCRPRPPRPRPGAPPRRRGACAARTRTTAWSSASTSRISPMPETVPGG